MTVSTDPLFSNLSAEDANCSEPTEIESLCVNCQENGVTKLLLTRIPHYKEIILMSFNCQHCGYSNNEIQSGGVIQEKGLKVKVVMQQQLQRRRSRCHWDSNSEAHHKKTKNYTTECATFANSSSEKRIEWQEYSTMRQKCNKGIGIA